MELKHVHNGSGVQGRLAFNRTSVELKRIGPAGPCAAVYSFNRTSVELKLIDFTELRNLDALLIEPAWN